ASNVPVTALMTAWFTARRRGLATGIVVSGSSVAIIITGPLVPRLLDVYGESGWRASWFLFGAVTIGLAICSYIVLRDRPGEVGQGLLGADSATGELAATRSGDGVHWKDVYRLPIVWHLGLVYIAFGFSYIIYMTFFAKSLMADGGYTKDAAGTLFMWVGWFSLFSGLIWGSVSDVIGRKRALIIVYLVHAVAFALFGLWPSPSGYSISAVLFGLAAWSIPAIMAAACGDLLGPRLAPVAFGFITLFFGLGQAIGPSVAGALADALGTFGPAYVLAAIVSLIGAGGVLALRAAPAASVRGGVGEVASDRIR
ncbi:MAG TPA: MFS transporter, partial [Anaerolineales bacterium]|nr:MFS transporter [Anaerolineales bacterium]